MTESEGEIEYLEEDADIVQQCVQITQDMREPGKFSTGTSQTNSSLLVERPSSEKKKKRKKEEDDSDYDPFDENVLSPPSPLEQIRKRKPPFKRVKPNVQNEVPKFKKARDFASFLTQRVNNRKKMNIRVPDYEDPLCLPVRAVKTNDSDVKRLNNWNNVCLEHFKHCDSLLKPERGETKASIRTAVFKNVVNKQTGISETTIWSKSCVENEDGDKKSEIFQCTLPRYREKKPVTKYSVLLRQQKKRFLKNIDEVILSKEDHKDGESLVVYKPKDSMTAVYRLIDKRTRTCDDATQSDEDTKMYLKELTCTKMCSLCFQTSWRGAKKAKQKPLVCPVCARTSVSVYNLLSHFKTHAARELARARSIISNLMAGLVSYHYRCRICRQKFDSISMLRQHVKKHQSTTESFKCEVCNCQVNSTFGQYKTAPYSK